MIIQDGEVRVNGEVCVQRGKSFTAEMNSALTENIMRS